MSKSAPVVWLLTDHKPGHVNQLRGLAQRLSELSGALCVWLDVRELNLSLWQVWRGAAVGSQLPTPELVVAAGSSTQRALLATKRHYGCPAVLLMRPNFPLSWLDACIIPAHDSPTDAGNVLVTEGVLNAIVPRDKTACKQALLLIGGPSKHFEWNASAIVDQVRTLCRESTDWHWILSDSRRTPEPMLPALAELKLNNLSLVSHLDTEPAWLAQTLADCARVWVSPDSVSMVYEALTSGASTGLLQLHSHGGGRVVGGLERLLNMNAVVSFDHRAELDRLDHKPIWEADRAARWIIERFFRDLQA